MKVAVPRKRRVLSREDRHLKRQKLGPLADLLLTANMKKRYEAALIRFFAFERLCNLPAPMDNVDLDGNVASYVEQLWQEGDPRYWAEDVLSGFTKMVPSLRGGFRLSWSLVTAWQKNEPPQRCAPLSKDILLAMIACASERTWHRFALLLAIGFHCLLRTAEMYHLRVADFEFDESFKKGVLVLRESKSGNRFNVVESVTITDVSLIRMFQNVMGAAQPGDLLFPEGAHAFRRCFDTLVDDLALPLTLLYKPYSIRRGAATADFLAHGKMSRTCVRGRWANEKTCRIYINESTTALSAIRFGKRAASLVKRYRQLAIDVWA